MGMMQHPGNRFSMLRSALPEWWPIMLGLLGLYVPTFYDLLRSGGVWARDEQAHGPLILLLSTWLLWRQWPFMLKRSTAPAGSHSGWVVLLLGSLLYVLGRSQQILVAEIGSLIWILIAVVLVKHGTAALKYQWFPFFLMLFMIPLPGVMVDAVTMPMKMAVSYIAEQLLYWAGYPIARSGVMLQIGQYQLLVANACAGLQTLLTLEALGLLYLNVVRHTSPFRNISLAVLIIPISLTANVIRVTALTLVTYHFGDAMGQGFLHGFAGMVLFLSALMLILTVDSVLQLMANNHTAQWLFKAAGR